MYIKRVILLLIYLFIFQIQLVLSVYFLPNNCTNNISCYSLAPMNACHQILKVYTQYLKSLCKLNGNIQMPFLLNNLALGCGFTKTFRGSNSAIFIFAFLLKRGQCFNTGPRFKSRLKFEKGYIVQAESKQDVTKFVSFCKKKKKKMEKKHGKGEKPTKH